MATRQDVKAILFDVDGTLLDTNEYIFQSYLHTFQKHKLPPRPRNEIMYLASKGRPLKECYQHLAPNLSTLILIKTHKDFQLRNLGLAKPFKNTLKTLRTLQQNNIKTAAITTRAKQPSIKSLKVSNIYKLLDIVITGDDVKHHKPNPEAILKALDLLQIPKENAIICGDTQSDILAGKNSRITTVAALYGFQKEEILTSKPDFVIKDISQIIPLLTKINA